MNTSPLSKLIIYGAGGHSKILVDLMRRLGTYDILGYIDDGLEPGTKVMGLPVLGGSALLPELRSAGIRLAVNAVGGINNVAIRIKVFDTLIAAGFEFPTLVHPSAVVEPSATLADGVQVLALSHVSSEAQVGFGSVVLPSVVVSHDCRIGKVVNLSPGAMLAGSVVVEDYAQIGMAATVNIGVRIGIMARVGNGATVKADVPDYGRVYAGAIWPPPRIPVPPVSPPSN
mgnify:CR=1 FL=1